jgi:hypothetical protein
VHSSALKKNYLYYKAKAVCMSNDILSQCREACLEAEGHQFESDLKVWYITKCEKTDDIYVTNLVLCEKHSI